MSSKIWGEFDPYLGFPKKLIGCDLQGWTSSNHPYLTEAITEKYPKIIVEIGVWKGFSVITMASKLRELQLDCVVVAIDTWLGAWDHWVDLNWREELCFQNDQPRIYDKFLSNIVNAELTDYVVPFPLDSVNACQVLKKQNVLADIIHIDGGHDYHAVQMDLTCWWDRLSVGGVLIVDDYNDQGEFWPEVYGAVNDFLKTHDHTNFSFKDGKCRFTKI